MKSLSVFDHAQIACGKCHKLFDFDVLTILNRKTDPELFQQLKVGKLLYALCTHCGNDARYPAGFLYHDPDNDELLVVLPYDFYQRYLYAQQIAEILFSSYFELEGNEYDPNYCHKKLKVIPLELFYTKINLDVFKGNSMGALHLSPFPTIKPQKKVTREIENIEDVNRHPYGYYIVEDNYSDGISKMINLLPSEFTYAHTYMPGKKISRNNQGTGTFGLSEIVIILGSTIVLPIFVGVVSSLISTLFIEKRKKRKELKESLKLSEEEKDPMIEKISQRVKQLLENQKNDIQPSDTVVLKLIDASTGSEYEFSGTLTTVNKDLKNFREQTLLTTQLNGDCHICNYYGNKFYDTTISNSINDLENLDEFYRSTVSSSTRVRFELLENENFYHIFKIVKESLYLMNNENYDGAIELLEPLLNGEKTPIDVLYNYGICLRELGYDDAAAYFFEQVIIRSINLPSLKESKSLIMGFEFGKEDEDKIMQVIKSSLTENTEIKKKTDKSFNDWKDKKYNE